ncbi:hypothetical protein PoB_006352400 [Plakobranchus ocellatus]|uniref:STAS domain-containing protein n=1 Tax=Plakobranchus ocellatus TaxID=259542 RepID=A0AAV4CYN6_9GAST|nr:hypothetical protein PoB_006352400 [Plakobranchus ocellatus]
MTGVTHPHGLKMHQVKTEFRPLLTFDSPNPLTQICAAYPILEQQPFFREPKPVLLVLNVKGFISLEHMLQTVTKGALLAYCNGVSGDRNGSDRSGGRDDGNGNGSGDESDADSGDGMVRVVVMAVVMVVLMLMLMLMVMMVMVVVMVVAMVAVKVVVVLLEMVAVMVVAIVLVVVDVVVMVV